MSGNLPPELTSFIGRRRLVQDAKAALASTRLLTLVGPGGVGKTRLAQRVAADLQRAVPDGAWLVELAGLHEPGLLPKTVMTALGLRDQSGQWTASLLVDYLAGRHALLVLDNCEHLVDACAILVDALLREAPGLRVLATSRQPLDVVGERVLLVTPLSFPDGNGHSSGEDVAQSEAVALLVERAASSTGGFAITDENRGAVVELVRRLDGMPLAIELAAGRLRSLGVRQVVERLDDRFRLLATGPRAAPERQRSLRSAIDWSYELLDRRERAALHRLAVFAGSFGLDAVEAVCPSPALSRAAVVDVLAALVDRSFVQRLGTTTEARYRLHETMREYAAERLRDAGDHHAATEAYVAFYSERVRESYRDWATPRLLDWLRWAEQESDNIRNVLEHSLATPNDVHRGLAMVGDLIWYWVIRALTEGAHWIDLFLESPGAAGHDELMGRALLARAFVAFFQADLSLARQTIARADALLQADADGRSFRLFLRSATELMAGDVAGARSAADEAVAIARGMSDSVALSRATLVDGRTAIIEGDAEHGLAASLESVGLARANGDLHMLGFGLASAGMACVALRRFQDGRRLLDEGIRVAQQIDDRVGLLLRLEALVSLLSGTGELERAARLIGVTVTLHRETGGQTHAPARVWIAEAERLGREALGDRRFESLRADGEALDRQAAVAFALGGRVGDDPASRRSAAKTDGVLGRREREVASLVATGLSNKEIAARLFLSERTVETHVYNILNKLGFNSRVQIARWSDDAR